MNKDMLIIGLGIGLLLSIGKIKEIKEIKEETSKEKLHLFYVGVELAQDVLKLQKEIEELKKEA